MEQKSISKPWTYPDMGETFVNMDIKARTRVELKEGKWTLKSGAKIIDTATCKMELRSDGKCVVRKNGFIPKDPKDATKNAVDKDGNPKVFNLEVWIGGKGRSDLSVGYVAYKAKDGTFSKSKNDVLICPSKKMPGKTIAISRQKSFFNNSYRNNPRPNVVEEKAPVVEADPF